RMPCFCFLIFSEYPHVFLSCRCAETVLFFPQRSGRKADFDLCPMRGVSEVLSPEGQGYRYFSGQSGVFSLMKKADT
ncbi:MAG: hypothetical protein IKS68_01380, partial [Mailhella sp.]|nr:hypothetical protein [Mailhella sp.]